MSPRVEALLSLYRLSLGPPVEGTHGSLAAWLEARQALIAGLARGGPGACDACIERALLALIRAADEHTRERLLRCKQRIGARLITAMRRPRGYGE